MEKDEKIQVALDEESKKESLQKYRELKREKLFKAGYMSK